MTDADREGPRHVCVVLFTGFELLDVFGPVEVFRVLPEKFAVSLVGPTSAPVRSAQGPLVLPDRSYEDASLAGPSDMVLVPGGIGTRELVKDEGFLRWLGVWSSGAGFVTSVCTGSAVLAAAGLLDGCRATSNKRAFAWVRGHGADVTWLPEARWVEDGNRWTSSGVAAGMDMALGLVARLHGHDEAQSIADRIELEWHSDSAWDPFAAKNGLVSS